MAATRFGRYEVVEHLASGGMADLFLARASGIEGFEKLVVVKSMLPSLAARSDLVELFLHEARLVASLNHPNIAQVNDVGVDDGRYFFAMEYVPGVDLVAVIRKGMSAPEEAEAMSLEAALTIGIAVCAGLHRAHEHRGADGAPLDLIHRDVSPSNVLVSWDGAVKLIDFGIAKALTRTEQTETGAIRGKIRYLSPEQCRSLPLDRRSDIYALSVLLLELTTSTRMQQADNEFDVMRAIIEDPPPRPSSRRKDYPPELERIVLKGLSKAPSDRYATAEAMQIELESFAREQRLAISQRTVARELERLFPDQAHAWRTDPFGARTPTGPRTPTGGNDTESMGHDVVGTPSNVTAETRRIEADVMASSSFRPALTSGQQPSSAQGSVRTVVPLRRAATWRRVGGLVLALTAFIAVLGVWERRRPNTTTTASGVSSSDLPRDVATSVRGISIDAVYELAVARSTTPDGAGSSATGIERLREARFASAITSFEGAAFAEPNNALIQAALASACLEAGDGRKAQPAARRAYELSGSLVQPDKTIVEAIYRTSEREFEEAVPLYESLAKEFPARVEYALRLSASQLASGDARKALATLSGFKQAAPHAAADLRVGLSIADAYAQLGQAEQERDVARNVVGTARAAGLDAFIVCGLLREADALRFTAPDEAIRIAHEAEALSKMQRDWAGEAAATVFLARATLDRSDHDEAEPLARRAIAVATEAGSLDLEVRGLRILASLQWERGKLAESDRTVKEAKQIADGLKDSAQVEACDILAARTHISAGRFPDAEAVLDGLEATVRAKGHRNLFEQLASLRGKIALIRGQIAKVRNIGEKPVDFSTSLRGECARAEGRLLEASHSFEASREQFDRGRDVVSASIEGRGLGAVLLDLGELDKARAILSSSTTFLEQRGLTDDAALGHLELARLATKGREAQGASRELAAARRHAHVTERPDVRLEVALASAVETAGRSAADGANALAAVQAEAERIGFVYLALRAQLEKARWSAKPDASGLQVLSAKARELGLLSLADSADKLAASR
jgi:serine/threonine protein kinase/tetratricopeptide (TPR) repeat protein